MNEQPPQPDQPGYPYAGATGPYQGYPMAPGGPGYPGPPVATGTNGFAIASLILGILGGVLLSVIFGIIALGQLRKRPQGGRGLAIGGLVASGCWVLIIAAGVTVAIISGAGSDDGNGDGTVAVTTLDPGDCINDLEETNSVENLPVVPCSAPHDGEVYAVFNLADGPWPGDTAVQQQAETRCNDEFDKYASSPDEKLELFYLHPLKSSWWRDRGVTCIATDPSGPRTGSLRD